QKFDYVCFKDYEIYWPHFKVPESLKSWLETEFRSKVQRTIEEGSFYRSDKLLTYIMIHNPDKFNVGSVPYDRERAEVSWPVLFNHRFGGNNDIKSVINTFE